LPFAAPSVNTMMGRLLTMLTWISPW